MMNRVFRTSEHPFEEIEFVAVGVDPDGSHVGILYRPEPDDDNSRVHFLHLCSHHNLKEFKIPRIDNCEIWVLPYLPERKSERIASYARLVIHSFEASEIMPYGFSDPRGFFDNNGNVVFNTQKSGLTCASFILAVFDASGFQLVEYDTWRTTEEDRRIQSSHAEENRNDEGYYKLLLAEIGKNRYAPLQVAGACTVEKPPVHYEDAKRLSQEIEGLLLEDRLLRDARQLLLRCLQQYRPSPRREV